MQLKFLLGGGDVLCYFTIAEGRSPTSLSDAPQRKRKVQNRAAVNLYTKQFRNGNKPRSADLRGQLYCVNKRKGRETNTRGSSALVFKNRSSGCLRIGCGSRHVKRELRKLGWVLFAQSSLTWERRTSATVTHTLCLCKWENSIDSPPFLSDGPVDPNYAKKSPMDVLGVLGEDSETPWIPPVGSPAMETQSHALPNTIGRTAEGSTGTSTLQPS